MRRGLRWRTLIVGAAVASSAARAAGAQRPTADSLGIREFAALSQRLGDRGGYFDTDNLISNESSLLHPLTLLERAQVRGGAYVGVGPDQNFNYIALTRPRIAFVVDIRRDNLLHHLLYKALFAAADSRNEFLALWLGRPVPRSGALPQSPSIDALLDWAARTPATPSSRSAALEAVRARVQRFGIPLNATDLATITRFHTAFMDEGVALRFTSTGRAPRDYYPTLGQLLAERDLAGKQRSWLASDEAFRTVQSLHRRNLIVPVVGDLSGARALPELAQLLRERGDSLSVLYTSNVEDYLIRDGRFPDFVRRLRNVPLTTNAVVIRSWFGGPGSHPLNMRGYYTTQLMEPLRTFLDARGVEQVSRYGQLVSRIR